MSKALKGMSLGRMAALMLLCGVGVTASPAEAAHRRHHHRAAAVHQTHAASRHMHIVAARPQPSSFIVDADTGRILEQENPDSLRYPASLTKMMTLYLTFDALRKGKLHLDDVVPVSAHAASQPQTNIALRPGEHIAVKDLILSIVIRSANDSAVTLGEALGGSESAFAERMTLTARKLGMAHTEFHNASGLPEPAQHTTARDMATLGLALKKHFPEYFPFFKTESFSYQGKTYITHNHVMVRYEGVDGIKTGFIRASGFNLVTSANRNGHHLVGVVMGGSTWKSRDDKMIALLDRTFTQLAMQDGKGGKLALASAERKSVLPARPNAADDNMDGEGDLPGEEIKNPAAANPNSSVAAGIVADAEWGIQVGAFARASEATVAANRARQYAPDELKNAVISVSGASEATAVHRAQLVHLTQAQANGACRKLAAMHGPCFIYKVD